MYLKNGKPVLERSQREQKWKNDHYRYHSHPNGQCLSEPRHGPLQL